MTQGKKYFNMIQKGKWQERGSLFRAWRPLRGHWLLPECNVETLEDFEWNIKRIIWFYFNRITRFHMESRI
jgi:hypothetical protein